MCLHISSISNLDKIRFYHKSLTILEVNITKHLQKVNLMNKTNNNLL